MKTTIKAEIQTFAERSIELPFYGRSKSRAVSYAIIMTPDKAIRTVGVVRGEKGNYPSINMSRSSIDDAVEFATDDLVPISEDMFISDMNKAIMAIAVSNLEFGSRPVVFACQK